MKFLPIYEGGLICSTTKDLSNFRLSPPSLAYQLKSAINCLELSVSYGRWKVLGQFFNIIFRIKDSFWTYIKSKRAIPNKLGPSSSEGAFNLDEDWIHKTMSWFSQWIVRNAPLGYIAEQRRQNYKILNSSLSDLPNCHSLMPKLPEHTVPWVFPLYVDNPEKYFHALRRQGIPVLRFGEFLDSSVNEQVCPVSVEYSKHVFQFPCHQSLTPAEMDWMLKKIKLTFSQ